MRPILLNLLVGLMFLHFVPNVLGTEAGGFIEPEVLFIPAGPFLRGSDEHEREVAYQLDEKSYGHSITRENRWYESEFNKIQVTVPDFSVTTTLITNQNYAEFIKETSHPAPGVNPTIWKSYGLIHPFERTVKYNWKDGTYPPQRGSHPVVLVSWPDAVAYARWLSLKTQKNWRLPTEVQWEKAARGTDGRYFPWGNEFDPANLNSHDLGPFDTVPVGQFEKGKSPFGLLDPAGQVFEWTRHKTDNGRVIVKGGSWDDKGCGVCRPAARHSRPNALKHILIGFRLVLKN